MGEHLKRARLDRSIQQKGAARALGCDPRTLLNWKKGRVAPDVRFWPAILAFLGYGPPALAYVETTIPSFYHTTRSGIAAAARREWTRYWWRLARDRYALVTSEAVLDELREGDYPSRAPALALVRDVPTLT